MKYHELLAQGKQQQGMTKLSAEQQGMIMKRAEDILQEKMSVITLSEQIAKQASEELDKLDFSDPELQKIAYELIAYGTGLADGEMMTKQAMVAQVWEDAYATFISKIAEVMGDEAAGQVDGALREAGGEEQAQADSVEELHQEITENVAQALVENAGGLEAVQQDPELSADILQQASDTASQIIEENMSASE